MTGRQLPVGTGARGFDGSRTSCARPSWRNWPPAAPAPSGGAGKPGWTDSRSQAAGAGQQRTATLVQRLSKNPARIMGAAPCGTAGVAATSVHRLCKIPRSAVARRPKAQQRRVTAPGNTALGIGAAHGGRSHRWQARRSGKRSPPTGVARSACSRSYVLIASAWFRRAIPVQRSRVGQAGQDIANSVVGPTHCERSWPFDPYEGVEKLSSSYHLHHRIFIFIIIIIILPHCRHSLSILPPHHH